MIIEEILHSVAQRHPGRPLYVLADEAVIDKQAANSQQLMSIQASEANKSLATATEVWRWLTAEHATRQAILVNIGGGMVCDLGGFAAATYLRGIDYINIPTTLLAMVDAAVGGKTAVNLDGLKNRVGAFRQPLETIIEPAFLDTLPPDELLSGYGEVIKTALLIGEEAFADALASLEQAEAFKRTSTGLELLNACREYKQSVVAQDPEEQGLRKVLNFGHTIGHALEEKTGAKHGYCVLWGLVAETYLSVVLCGCPKHILQALVRVMLDNYGRPSCNCKEQSELVDLMHKDKKNDGENKINFTLLKKAGDPIINQVADESLINEALDYLFSL